MYFIHRSRRFRGCSKITITSPGVCTGLTESELPRTCYPLETRWLLSRFRVCFHPKIITLLDLQKHFLSSCKEARLKISKWREEKKLGLRRKSLFDDFWTPWSVSNLAFGAYTYLEMHFWHGVKSCSCWKALFDNGHSMHPMSISSWHEIEMHQNSTVGKCFFPAQMLKI